jgi:hypothetical protein
MPPVIYTDLSWSAQPRRWLRTLQVVAIAGAVGAVGGGVGALALMGLHVGSSQQQFSSSSRQASVKPAVPASPQSAPALAAQPQPATSAPAPTISPAPPSPAPSPSRLATASAPPAAVRSEGLYDHAEPPGSEQAAADRTVARPAGAPAHAKRSSRRVSKPALALRPPRGPVLSEDDDWRYNRRDDYRSNWGGGFFDHDDWRN